MIAVREDVLKSEFGKGTNQESRKEGKEGPKVPPPYRLIFLKDLDSIASNLFP